MIDTHAHYSRDNFNNEFKYLTYKDEFVVKKGTLDDVFADMKAKGVTAYIEPAVELDSNYVMLDFYVRHKGFMYLAVGVHPLRVQKLPWKRRKELLDLAGREGVVAIGETGLDYHRHERKKQRRFYQKLWFLYQILLAHKKKLPLVLHVRAASEDALKILKRHKKLLHGGSVHCFNNNAEVAMEYIKLGFHIGIGGALLERGNANNHKLRAAVKAIPLDRILLETDAPFVLPDLKNDEGEKLSHRVRNTSAVMLAVAQEIARIKRLDVSEVLAAAERNTRKVFSL